MMSRTTTRRTRKQPVPPKAPEHPPACAYCGETLRPWQTVLCPTCRRLLKQPAPGYNGSRSLVR